MTDAPKTIWTVWNEEWGVYNVNDHGDQRYTDDEAEEYTLTSSVEAQLKAADELAERAQLDGDTDGISDEMWKALTAYRKAREASK